MRRPGKSLLEHMWLLLDNVMDDIMSGEDGDELQKLKGQAFGIAECLALMTNPIHATVDDIRARAVQRWEARQDGSKLAHPGDGKWPTTADVLIAATGRRH